MSNLITIKQVGELTGVESQPSVHAWLKKWGIGKVKKESRTFVNKGDVMIALEKQGSRAKQTVDQGATNDSNVKPARAKAEVERPEDADLITVSEAMELLGVKGQASVHSLIKRYKIVKVVVGRRVYVSKQALLDTKDVAAPPSGNGVAKQDKPNPFKKFEGNPKLIAWNKGEYRGWAVAAITDLSPSTVSLLVDYGKEFMWPHDTVAKSIAEGKMFYMEPHEVLRFVSLQLLRVKDGHGDVASIVKELSGLAERLKQVKLDVEASAEGVAQPKPEDIDADVEDADVGQET